MKPEPEETKMIKEKVKGVLVNMQLLQSNNKNKKKEEDYIYITCKAVE